MDNITDTDLYNAARDAGVLIVTQAEEDAAIKYGRAVLALRMAPATPQLAREPLTEEQMDDATANATDALMDHVYEYGSAAEGQKRLIQAIGRCVERAHGIGSKA